MHSYQGNIIILSGVTLERFQCVQQAVTHLLRGFAGKVSQFAPQAVHTKQITSRVAHIGHTIGIK